MSRSYPDYGKEADIFAEFLQQHQIHVQLKNDDEDAFIEPNHGDARIQVIRCYSDFLQRIVDRNFYTASTRMFVMEIPLDELVVWDPGRGKDLASRVTKNTLRYIEIFCSVVDQALSGIAPSDRADPNQHRDPIDIFRDQRLAQQATRETRRNHYNANHADNIHAPRDDRHLQGNDANNRDNSNENEFPPLLMRRYELRILPHGRPGSLPPFINQVNTADTNPPPQAVSLRQIRSECMGHLVTVTGMVSRASDVKPCCQVATYSCDSCGLEVYQVVQNQREFLPARMCQCKQPLHLQTRGGKFVKFQELKLQETPSQVPMGHVPRSMSVLCRGEVTRQCSPGDTVTLDGVFLPQRLAESGYRAMKAGLISTTFLEAQNVIVHKMSYDESLNEHLTELESEALESAINTIAQSEDPMGKLASALAPEIYGHDDIKRSLLLQLVGGCTRTLPDGMRIRGDINICLMGDPGVAKSQLLKHVASIAPRGIYTTGKGSSGVGLTAAVTKDMTTGEMALEGGALVLADRGICCIDEFDKMDESDRTAIHEVMEQQTVSIAKAGIVATLNARSAVLAAANPLYSRYNRRKSLSENINLPNSLLSRFDLLFLVLDVADVDRDMALARHVTLVHQNEGYKESSGSSKDASDDVCSENNKEVTTMGGNKDVIPSKILREYITRARKHHPIMPSNVAPYVIEAYVNLRLQERGSGSSSRGDASSTSKHNDQTVMTARQLLSILRLSQALARLRFSDFVAREDVDEAIRLTHMSKASLLDDSRGEKGGKREEDVISQIFHIIRDYSVTCGTRKVDLKLCEAMVLRKGYTSQLLQTCLEEYETLEVIQITSNRTHVYFLK